MEKAVKTGLGILGSLKHQHVDIRQALLAVGRKLAGAKGVPCTACHYCVSHCPVELDIPRLLELYNEHLSRPDFAFIAPMALGAMPADKHPSACIGCGACENLCPARPMPAMTVEGLECHREVRPMSGLKK